MGKFFAIQINLEGNEETSYPKFDIRPKKYVCFRLHEILKDRYVPVQMSGLGSRSQVSLTFGTYIKPMSH